MSSSYVSPCLLDHASLLFLPREEHTCMQPNSSQIHSVYHPEKGFIYFYLGGELKVPFRGRRSSCKGKGIASNTIAINS
jgi:hypothetical protein